jgi:hypothetical protein
MIALIKEGKDTVRRIQNSVEPSPSHLNWALKQVEEYEKIYGSIVADLATDVDMPSNVSGFQNDNSVPYHLRELDKINWKDLGGSFPNLVGHRHISGETRNVLPSGQRVSPDGYVYSDEVPDKEVKTPPEEKAEWIAGDRNK